MSTNHNIESLDDYLARLNLEGDRGIWSGNHQKIKFFYKKTKSYLKPGNKIAEFGIGDGYMLDLQEDAGMKCTGLDISSYLIKYHTERVKKENRNIEFGLCDIASSEFKYTGFDAVYCLDILEHISEEQYLVALKNVHSMLNKNGLFIGTVPFEENLLKKMVKCPDCGSVFHTIGHQHAFTMKKLETTLSAHFEIKKIGLVSYLHKTDVGRRLKKLLRHPFKKLAEGDTVYFIAVKK